jgi:hypothetical protein
LRRTAHVNRGCLEETGVREHSDVPLTCQECQELMRPFCRRTSTDMQSRFFKQHLRGCEDCREIFLRLGPALFQAPVGSEAEELPDE